VTTASRPAALSALRGRSGTTRRAFSRTCLAVALALACAACSSPLARQTPAAGTPAPGRAGDQRPAAGATAALAPPLPVDTSIAGRLPLPLEREVALAWDGRLLLAGGLGPTGASTTTVLALPATSGAATLSLALGSPTHDAGGVLDGGTLLVAGGGQATSTGAVQLLRLVPGAHARPLPPLPVPRSDLCAAPWRGGAVLAGGYDGTRPTLTVLEIGRAGRARGIGRLLRGVRYAACALDGSTLYLAGGLAFAGGAWEPTRLVQAVDLHTGQVRVAGELPEPVAGASAALLGGSLYVLGGEGPSGPYDAVLGYDPETQRFLPEGRLPVALAFAGAASFGDVVYLAGGDGGQGPLDTIVAVAVAGG
jgi:hypothetical protein